MVESNETPTSSTGSPTGAFPPTPPEVQTVMEGAEAQRAPGENLLTPASILRAATDGNESDDEADTEGLIPDEASQDTEPVEDFGNEGRIFFGDDKCNVILAGNKLRCGHPKDSCPRRNHRASLQQNPTRTGAPGYCLATWNSSHTVLDGVQSTFGYALSAKRQTFG